MPRDAMAENPGMLPILIKGLTLLAGGRAVLDDFTIVKETKS